MTAFNGNIIERPAHEEVEDGNGTFISSNILDLPGKLIYIDSEDEITEAVIGDWTQNLPIPMRERNHGGNKVQTFQDDYYHRFHLTPNKVDFEFILSPVVKTFLLWNAYFISKPCTAINQVNGNEYDLEGLTAPFSLTALQETEYIATASTDGSAQFESTITFDFGVENDYIIVTLEGVRILLFRWEPLQPIKESLEWLTNVLTAKDGSEQRISTRRLPRQGFKFSVHFETQKEQAILDAELFKGQKRAWGLPIWSEWAPHSATISINDTVIIVDTTKADFRDDSMAIIWKSRTKFEVVNIETVADGSLTLSSGIVQEFTGIKYIVPLRIAYMNSTVSRSDAPDGYSRMTFSFIVRDNIELSGYSANTEYNSLPVLTKATYVDGTQSKKSDGAIMMADNETGQFLIFSDAEFNKNTQQHVFKNYTKAETWEHRLFLHSMLGQLNLVWIPTFKHDMVQSAIIESADVLINIDNIGLTNNMGLNDLRTHIAFISPNGSMVFREIVGIAEISSLTEQIQIDSSLGYEIAVGDVMLSFLDKYRLNSDDVSIRWDHRGWHESELNWLRVKQ